MSEREAVIKAFLERAGWGRAIRTPLVGDASTRRYERLSLDGRPAMLMDQPPGEGAACPPDASVEARKGLGYNAVARLAGPDCRPFAAVATYLRELNLSAPDIIAHDYKNGLLVTEDLGDPLFARATEDGMDPQPLYETAIDTLALLHRHAAPKTLAVPGATPVHLLPYDEAAMAAETDLLAEWFLGSLMGRELSDAQWAEYRGLWAEVLPLGHTPEPVMVLRDYHAENLIWMPQRRGIARAGLIDFQDALAGHPAYDLISLLEDARRDVDPALRAAMTTRYVAARRQVDPHFDEEAFRAAAAMLSAQRNAKIVGIFARLWKRDEKPRYLKFLPRVWGYLTADLEHRKMARLKRWFDGAIPSSLRGEPEAR